MSTRSATEGEARWPAALAIVAAIGLYASLPDRYTIGPAWLVPALEAAVLVGLMTAAPRRHPGEAVTLRALTMVLTGIITVTNFFALFQLVDTLLHGSQL